MANGSTTSEIVREHLIGEHFAPAQQLPIQIQEMFEPEGDILGDWFVHGVFINNEQYKGSLSGLGIRLESGITAGHVNLRALPGLKPLVPEFYIELESMKSNSSSADQVIQPFASWISIALDKDSITLQSADSAWLERKFSGHHCVNVIADLAYDENGALYRIARKTPNGPLEKRFVTHSQNDKS